MRGIQRHFFGVSSCQKYYMIGVMDNIAGAADTKILKARLKSSDAMSVVIEGQIDSSNTYYIEEVARYQTQ